MDIDSRNMQTPTAPAQETSGAPAKPSGTKEFSGFYFAGSFFDDGKTPIANQDLLTAKEVTQHIATITTSTSTLEEIQKALLRLYKNILTPHEAQKLPSLKEVHTVLSSAKTPPLSGDPQSTRGQVLAALGRIPDRHQFYTNLLNAGFPYIRLPESATK